MVRRAAAAAVLGGAYVFPGGALDDTDRGAAGAARVHGLDDRLASERLALPAGGLAFWLAAVRETFEEAGVLLARHRDGAPLRPDVAAAVHAARASLCAGDDRVRGAARRARPRRRCARHRVPRPLDHAADSRAPLRHAVLRRVPAARPGRAARQCGDDGGRVDGAGPHGRPREPRRRGARDPDALGARVARARRDGRRAHRARAVAALDRREAAVRRAGTARRAAVPARRRRVSRGALERPGRIDADVLRPRCPAFRSASTRASCA